MKKTSLLIIVSLVGILLLPTMGLAGNVKKVFINVSKEGQKAQSNDIPSNYGNIEIAMKNISYNLNGTTNGILMSGASKGKEGELIVSGEDGSYAYIPINGFLSTEKDFTMEIQMKPEQTPPSNNGKYEEMVFAWEGWHRGIVYHENIEKVSFAFWYTQNGSGVRREATTPLKLGETAVITGVYKAATRTLEIYKNGELVQSTPVNLDSTWAFVTHSGPAKLGTMGYNYGGYRFKGSIFYAKAWTRALTADEVKQKHGKSSTFGEAGLVGEWRFY